MNSFGHNFRIQIFGESHGPLVGVVIDGCLHGIPITPEDFSSDLDRRRGGVQKATTPRKEDDIPIIQSGVFNGFTTGAPLCIVFTNNTQRSEDYEKQKAIPRPGHADYTASIKFGGFNDYRGGGHFSGRLTVALVAAGVIAKKILNKKLAGETPFSIHAKLIEVGGIKDIEQGIQKAIEAKDSVGGIVECIVKGLPVGLGEPFFNSVESLISHAIFSIPAVKGIEFGAGFAAAAMFGSEHNDVMINDKGKTATNNAGGVLGGITNGNELVFRVAVKPTSSTPQPQESFNMEKGEMDILAVRGRHDLCIALRVPVVVEAVTACVLADFLKDFR